MNEVEGEEGTKQIIFGGLGVVQTVAVGTRWVSLSSPSHQGPQGHLFMLSSSSAPELILSPFPPSQLYSLPTMQILGHLCQSLSDAQDTS